MLGHYHIECILRNVCVYLFVDFLSIEDKQKEFAKLWISSIGLLPFIHTYSIKFNTVITTIDIYYQSLEATNTKPEVIQALKKS